MGIIELEGYITHTLPRITDPFIETQRKKVRGWWKMFPGSLQLGVQAQNESRGM